MAQGLDSQNPLAIYNVDRWGDGFFSVDENGCVTVRPCGSASGPSATLEQVLAECRKQGLRSPVLVRFAGILRQRVKALAGAFRSAIAEQNYQGGYTPVYPIKVNQQRRVVTEILGAIDDGEIVLVAFHRVCSSKSSFLRKEIVKNFDSFS